MTKPFDVMLGVPIDSSGAFVGCERLPAALRAAGLVEALGIPDLGNLQVTIADPVRDPEHGVLGLDDAANACQVVRRELAPLLADGKHPLVVGGCCTLLIGVMAALHDIGKDAGLLFVDGHLDCYDGSSSPGGEAADMELAVLLGVGAPQLTEIAPTLSDRRVVALGNTDEEEAAGNGSPDPRQFAPAMPIVDYAELARDPAGHAQRAREHLRDPDGFWLHLDLDVLSKAELPAVDYAADPGITWDELLVLLRPTLADPALLGADVTILNPTMDPDGRYAARAVELLREACAENRE
jgi:arginase